jgi:hypothetical protein
LLKLRFKLKLLFDCAASRWHGGGAFFDSDKKYHCYRCCRTQSSTWALCLRNLEEPWRQSRRRLDWLITGGTSSAKNNRLLLRHHNAPTALKYIRNIALYLVHIYNLVIQRRLFFRVIAWTQSNFGIETTARHSTRCSSYTTITEQRGKLWS